MITIDIVADHRHRCTMYGIQKQKHSFIVYTIYIDNNTSYNIHKANHQFEDVSQFVFMIVINWKIKIPYESIACDVVAFFVSLLSLPIRIVFCFVYAIPFCRAHNIDSNCLGGRRGDKGTGSILQLKWHKTKCQTLTTICDGSAWLNSHHFEYHRRN